MRRVGESENVGFMYVPNGVPGATAVVLETALALKLTGQYENPNVISHDQYTEWTFTA